MFLSPDTGTSALSGANNDFAEVFGPASNGTVGLANDSLTGDANDVAYLRRRRRRGALHHFHGLPVGASLQNATGSDAEVFGGGQAIVNNAGLFGAAGPVSNSSAIATNGGFAGVENDNLGPASLTVTNDYAFGNGTATGTTALGAPLANTPSVANIYDSQVITAIANNTGFNFGPQTEGAGVELARNGFDYATGQGSGADIIGTVAAPVTNVSNIEPDGDIFQVLSSNTAVFDGTPDATFFADLFGADGAATMSADWTALLAAFGL